MRKCRAGGNQTATPDVSFAGNHPPTAERAMNTIDFFEYLAEHEQTSDLAHALADIWTDHQLAVLERAA